MHPNGPEDPLLTHDLCRTNPRPPGKQILRLNFGGLLRDLIAWQNASGARAGLLPIPDVDGRQWPIAPRQFRRTLAREIAFRPHGTIASKIQLKHVHAHVTEGYWGPAGESAQRFIDELDREQRAASEQRMRQRFEEWQQGLPIASGAQHRLQTGAHRHRSRARRLHRHARRARTTPAKAAAQTRRHPALRSAQRLPLHRPLPGPLPEERLNSSARRAVDRRLPAGAVRQRLDPTTTTSPPGEA